MAMVGHKERGRRRGGIRLARRWLALGVVVTAGGGLAGCTTLSRATKLSYDRRGVTIETFSLFNQRPAEENGGAGPRWQGDWYLRRLRLALLDQNMRSGKPDVVVLQEAMARQFHVADDDRDILGVGALRGYQWDKQVARSYPDTEENESLLVAVGAPLVIDEALRASEEPRVIDLGNGSHASWVRVMNEKRPILLFNVDMADEAMAKPEAYEVLQRAIEEAAAKDPRICADRIVLAGRFTGTTFDLDFIRRMQLKDVSAGVCEVAERCHTATTANDLYAMARPGYLPLQVDRIFVPQSAVVSASRRTEDAGEEVPDAVKHYGLKRLYPGDRFGWTATVRFNRCE